MAPSKKKNKIPKSQAVVPKFCQRVIDDVITNMRQPFLDDGVGEQALQRMLHMWRSKMMKCESIDLSPAIPPPKDTEKDSAQEPGSVKNKQEPGFDCIKQEHGSVKIKQEPGSSSSKSTIPIKQEISKNLGTAKQLDGAFDDSDDDDNPLAYEDSDDESDDDAEISEPENSEAELEDFEEEPLNSDDDLTDDEDPETKFESENGIACQYDVVSRSRNKWKFVLRDGMMKVHGKEFVFKRAEGDALW